MKKISIALILLSIGGFALAEKIYKWVDEDGQIHYSSQKPTGQQVETVKVKKGPKVSAKTNENVNPTQNAVENNADVADAAAKAQLAKTDEANKRKLCEQSRSNVAALNATVRVARIDEKTGETVRMNDEQRLASMKAALEGIKEYCK